MRRLVSRCRWLFTPELAADEPHREVFELDAMGPVTRLTVTFDEYEDESPSYLTCDMARTGDALKSLLETGTPLFGASPTASTVVDGAI